MEKDIILKAWEVYQGLAQGLGDTCWKIRSIFYAASSALIAYAFAHSEPFLYGVSTALTLAFFILESGYKQIQDQYIRKSIAIERTLNDILVDEAEPFLPPNGISTSIVTPTIPNCFRQITFKKFFFWFPYAIVFFLSLLMWWTGVSSDASTTVATAVVNDASIDSTKRKVTVQSVNFPDWIQTTKAIAGSLADINAKLTEHAPIPTAAPSPAPMVTSAPTPTPSATPTPSSTPKRRSSHRP